MAGKIITIMVVCGLVMPPLIQTTQAAVVGTGISFGSCAAAGFLSNKVTQGLTELEGWTRSKLGNLAKRKLKVGSATLSVPVYDSDVESEVKNFKGVYSGKEGVQDLIARCGAREILTAMGKNITNTARTAGRDGGASWVRNWRNFRLKGQQRGENVFRVMLSQTNVCDYFNTNVKDLFDAKASASLKKVETRSNQFDSFAVQNGCTLPKNFKFFEYKQNFSRNGGWQAWNRLMEPQNNYYGVMFRSLDEANRQRAIEEQADIDEAGPTGFTSTRGRNTAANCAVKSQNNRCLIYNDILTPAGILSGAVTSGIAAELQWVATSDELNEVMASAINILVSRLVDLSDSDEGDYEVPGDPGYDPGTLPGSADPEAGQEPVQTCIDNCAQDPDYNSCVAACNNPGVGVGPFGNITVNFEIINNNGGSATVDDFRLFISGEQTAIGLLRVLSIGNYSVTSSAPSGYQLTGIRGACDGDGTVTINENDNLTCVVTYNDI